MSAWPEAIYIINKFNYAMDAKLDIDENGIQNINDLNDRIDALNLLVNKPEDPNRGIAPIQEDIIELLNTIQDQIDELTDPETGIIASIQEQLDTFEEDLDNAVHTIVFVGSQQPANVRANSVWLVEEV